MLKVIQPGSFDFGMAAAQLIDVHTRGVDKEWMQKRASIFDPVVADIRPEKGYEFIHLISMGAQEAYGYNRNGDGFNEKSAEFELEDPKAGVDKIQKLGGGLIDYHPTFAKYAHVYRHHKNTDPEKRCGDVKHAAYNDSMRRGELIIRVPSDPKYLEKSGACRRDIDEAYNWQPKLEKLANGQDLAFSMACKVANDMCSICGNRARSRAEYCDHLKDNMTSITKAGNQVGAINDEPGFFDISDVFRPADRIAYALQKVAEFDFSKMSGAEIAEVLELSAPQAILLPKSSPVITQKLAAASKLAAIEKQIEGSAFASGNTHLKKLAPAVAHKSIPEDCMGQLRSVKTSEAISALNTAQICLSPRDFCRLVMGAEKTASISDDIVMVESMLPGVYTHLTKTGGDIECAMDSSYDPSGVAISRRIADVAGRLMNDHSLADGYATKRSNLSIIRGTTSKIASSDNVKYASVSKHADYLLKEYAKYQLAFARLSDNDLTNGLTVLGNYITNQQLQS